MVENENMEMWMERWRKSLIENGEIDLASLFKTKKVEDRIRLDKTMLPQSPSIQLPYKDYKSDQTFLNFIDKHPILVVRLLAEENNLGLRRNGKPDIKGKQEVYNFIEQVKPEHQHLYSLDISAQPLTQSVGTIICDDYYSLVEIGYTNLHTNLAQSRGDIITKSGIYRLNRNLKYWNNPSKEEKQLLTKILQTFTTCNVSLKSSYAEFVVTTDEKIEFIDYKENQMYSSKVREFAPLNSSQCSYFHTTQTNLNNIK